VYAFGPETVRPRPATLREFVRERGYRHGIAVTNDSEPGLLDDRIVAIPFSHP
jgi:hypothetical protein